MTSWNGVDGKWEDPKRRGRGIREEKKGDPGIENSLCSGLERDSMLGLETASNSEWQAEYEGELPWDKTEMKEWAGLWRALCTLPRCMAFILTFFFPSLFFAQIISNITVLNFLQALGYLHTKEELLESELDVLKSLNFQINLPTPLAYVEMLLEVLGILLC